MSNGIRVSPIDIQQKRFHMVFRGYDRTEVEMFLDLVRDEMETLVREVTEQREFPPVLRPAAARIERAGRDGQEHIADDAEAYGRAEGQRARKRRCHYQGGGGAQVCSSSNNAQDEKAKLGGADIQELKRRKHHFLQDVKKVIEMHREHGQLRGGRRCRRRKACRRNKGPEAPVTLSIRIQPRASKNEVVADGERRAQDQAHRTAGRRRCQ